MTQTPQQIAAIVTQKLKKGNTYNEDFKSTVFKTIWNVVGDLGAPISNDTAISIVKALRKGNTDAKQIASKQEYEVYRVSHHYQIPKDVVLAVIKEVGTSRVRVYAVLREMGYTIDTSTRKK